MDNNVTVYSWKSTLNDDMCRLPMLEKTMRIMNIDNYIPQEHHKFAHGTVLMVSAQRLVFIHKGSSMKCEMVI